MVLLISFPLIMMIVMLGSASGCVVMKIRYWSSPFAIAFDYDFELKVSICNDWVLKEFFQLATNNLLRLVHYSQNWVKTGKPSAYLSFRRYNIWKAYPRSVVLRSFGRHVMRIRISEVVSERSIPVAVPIPQHSNLDHNYFIKAHQTVSSWWSRYSG